MSRPVRDLNGKGHAVLTVKTDHGDFVLDNLSDEIRPWTATGYQFYKRQAQDDPNVWLSLGGATGSAPGTAASNCGRQAIVEGKAAGRQQFSALDSCKTRPSRIPSFGLT